MWLSLKKKIPLDFISSSDLLLKCNEKALFLKQIVKAGLYLKFILQELFLKNQNN